MSILLPCCAALKPGAGRPHHTLVWPTSPPAWFCEGEWSTWQIATLRKCWVCFLVPVPSSQVIERLHPVTQPLLGAQWCPVVETLHLQRGGLRFDPWLGNQEPTS